MNTVVVWVLVITMHTRVAGGATNSMVVVDNIASAASCEQLAKVHRYQNGYGKWSTAICAPVKKVKL